MRRGLENKAKLLVLLSRGLPSLILVPRGCDPFGHGQRHGSRPIALAKWYRSLWGRQWPSLRSFKSRSPCIDSLIIRKQ